MKRQSRKTVVFAHPILPEAHDVLRPKFRIVVAETRAKLKRVIPQADGLITMLENQVDEDLISRAPKLKVIGNFAVGYNNIDLDACRKYGVRVVNTPRVLTRATAELTLGLLIATARRFYESEKLCREGRFKGWQPDLLLGLQLKGRNAVLVGRGRIGQETGRLFKAVGLNVEFIRSTDKAAEVKQKLRRAQVLSLHLPLNARTHHWLNRTKIALLPKDCIVLNTSRGPIIDEKALISALASRKIFGAGLDVFENEPHIPNQLRSLKNVYLLPHIGSATSETRAEMARLAASGVAAVLSGQHPWNEVQF